MTTCQVRGVDFKKPRHTIGLHGNRVRIHINSKFMGRVNEQEQAIRQILIVKNKFMSICDASVLLLITNFLITLSS